MPSRVAAACSASHGTASDWEPAAVETRAEPISLCRKRSFGTRGRWRLPASATVCLIPCLILWFADVESVGKCRAPNSPGGLNGRIASVIASLFSSSRPPPPARASYLEPLILPTATATPPQPQPSLGGFFLTSVYRRITRTR